LPKELFQGSPLCAAQCAQPGSRGENRDPKGLLEGGLVVIARDDSQGTRGKSCLDEFIIVAIATDLLAQGDWATHNADWRSVSNQNVVSV
jgi:hypothetical protein